MRKIKEIYDFRKELALFGILILAIILLSGLVESQEGTYCAEKTTYGASCQDVPQAECATGINPSTMQPYKCDRTACKSTTYCSTGTCADRVTGKCLPGQQATCNPAQGGFFYSLPKDEVSECKVGCCFLGDGNSLVEKIRCDVLGKDYNVEPTFRADITDEDICLALASPEAKGACVFETEKGRECEFTTRGDCLSIESVTGGESSTGFFEGLFGGTKEEITTNIPSFHEGFLCTAPELGTICAMTKRTKCVPGEHEVFFEDSCGNTANVYDANKINNVAYWSYVPGVQGVEVNYGDGKGNINSKKYGACSYLKGSTCGSGAADYGNFICRDLGCPANSDPLTGGVRREHGDEWCSEPISNFENAKPGQISYLLYCYNGEVQYELCDFFRNKLCSENKETGAASCVVNRWSDCIFQENTRDCLDTSIRDCRVEKGASALTLRTQYGTEKQILDSDTGKMITGTCVPKYTPGFKFWDPEGTILDVPEETETPLSICEFSSVTCLVPYTQEVIGITAWRTTPSDECVSQCKSVEGWSNSKCYEACTPVCLESLDSKNADAKIVKDWAQSYQNLCTSLGDCGVVANYLEKEGYNRWRDLFTGEQIDWETLVNADEKK